mmetsp:Transcript_24579/g.58309  ORF Transcript_24579/g.58309 Transcript_24579/m.58309 type:complete len:201 (-) Transcript_24579:288-890(-)
MSWKMKFDPLRAVSTCQGQPISLFRFILFQLYIYSSTSGFAYDTMNHVISPATLNAARMGTAKMAGVPNNAPKTSDSTVVGSKVPAACSSDDEEDDNGSDCDNGKDIKISSTIGSADRFNVVLLEKNDCPAVALVAFPHVTTKVLDGDDAVKPMTAVDGNKDDIIRPTMTTIIDNRKEDGETRLVDIIMQVPVVGLVVDV